MGLIVRSIILFVAFFANAYADEYRGNDASRGFSRCAAFYGLMAAGVQNDNEKHMYLKIADTSFRYAVVSSDYSTVIIEIPEERGKLVKEINSLGSADIDTYVSDVKFQCAMHLRKHKPNPK